MMTYSLESSKIRSIQISSIIYLVNNLSYGKDLCLFTYFLFKYWLGFSFAKNY